MTKSEHHDGDELYLRLEVARTASPGEVTRAYRRLAHSAHPDANPDDPDASRRFREITEAYEVLGNPSRRALYDADHARERGVAAPRPGTAGFAGPSAPRAGRLGGLRSGGPSPAPPVFIGTRQWPELSPFFWAGPVHVEEPRPGGAPASGQAAFASEAGRLLSEIRATWGWD